MTLNTTYISSTYEMYRDYNPDMFTSNYLINLDAIYISIRHILATPIGTRLNKPTFGSKLAQLLMEPMDEVTADNILLEGYAAVERWEPRVNQRFQDSSVEPNYESHTYFLQLAFSVKGLGEGYFKYKGELKHLAYFS